MVLNLCILCVILYMMAQYPSCSFAAESVPKNTRKGKSMKLLVLAVNAQLGVGAGRIGLWAGCNGIRQSTHLPLEALFCGSPVVAFCHTERGTV